MGQFCPPPLQGGYELITAVGSSNTMQIDETHGYLKSVRSGAEPRRPGPDAVSSHLRRGQGGGADTERATMAG